MSCAVDDLSTPLNTFGFSTLEKCTENEGVQDTHIRLVFFGMYFILETDLFKEIETSAELSDVEEVLDVYVPMYRYVPKDKPDARPRFTPLISRMLFVNLSEYKTVGGKRVHLSGDKLDEHLIRMFNDRGYFFYDIKHPNGEVEHRKSKAHLLGANQKNQTKEELFKSAKISTPDVDSLRLFVDQMNSTMTEYTVVNDNYDLLESTQDTVMFTEGPYKGFQGIVKQKTVKRDRSRYFYIRVANWTFCIPNARSGRYVVMKEATHGKKAREVTAWTNIDLLLARFQALSKTVGLTPAEAITLADDSASLLRLLLLSLGNKQRIEDFAIETASAPKLADKPLNQLLLLFICGSKNPLGSTTSPQVLRPVLKANEASALISLNRYYLSTANNIDYVLCTHIPDVSLRPFLTPTPGIEIKENEDYATIEHADFTEYIYKVDLAPYMTLRCEGQAYTYYAHIGIKDDRCFVNWGELTRKLQATLSDDFIADLNKKGMTRLVALLQSTSDTGVSPANYSFYDDPKNHIHGFSWRSENPSAGGLEEVIPLLYAAVELWQSTRLLPLRNLLRRCVLLHRDPIFDQLVPINPAMESILYDDKGLPRQLTEEDYIALNEYVIKIDNALRTSCQYGGINYAVILYHQLLSSVSGYIETSLDVGSPTSFTKLDAVCTAAFAALQSNRDNVDTPQLEAAMSLHEPTIAYIRKSPSYLRTGLPSCLGKNETLNKRQGK